MNIFKDKMLTGEQLVHARVQEKVLPVRGPKACIPSHSWLENKQVQNLLDSTKDLLAQERIEKIGSLAHAEWDEKKQLAKVTIKTGRIFEKFGFEDKKFTYLYPEEALFLLETNRLEILYGGVSMSLQQAYNTLLGPKAQCTLLEYLVFAHLLKYGFRVLRHSPKRTVTPYELRIGLHNYILGQKQQKFKSNVNHNLQETNTSPEKKSKKLSKIHVDNIDIKTNETSFSRKVEIVRLPTSSTVKKTENILHNSKSQHEDGNIYGNSSVHSDIEVLSEVSFIHDTNDTIETSSDDSDCQVIYAGNGEDKFSSIEEIRLSDSDSSVNVEFKCSSDKPSEVEKAEDKVNENKAGCENKFELKKMLKKATDKEQDNNTSSIKYNTEQQGFSDQNAGSATESSDLLDNKCLSNSQNNSVVCSDSVANGSCLLTPSSVSSLPLPLDSPVLSGRLLSENPISLETPPSTQIPLAIPRYVEQLSLNSSHTKKSRKSNKRLYNVHEDNKMYICNSGKASVENIDKTIYTTNEIKSESKLFQNAVITLTSLSQSRNVSGHIDCNRRKNKKTAPTEKEDIEVIELEDDAVSNEANVVCDDNNRGTESANSNVNAVSGGSDIGSDNNSSEGEFDDYKHEHSNDEDDNSNSRNYGNEERDYIYDEKRDILNSFPNFIGCSVFTVSVPPRHLLPRCIRPVQQQYTISIADLQNGLKKRNHPYRYGIHHNHRYRHNNDNTNQISNSRSGFRGRRSYRGYNFRGPRGRNNAYAFRDRNTSNNREMNYAEHHPFRQEHFSHTNQYNYPDCAIDRPPEYMPFYNAQGQLFTPFLPPRVQPSPSGLQFIPSQFVNYIEPCCSTVSTIYRPLVDTIRYNFNVHRNEMLVPSQEQEQTYETRKRKQRFTEHTYVNRRKSSRYENQNSSPSSSVEVSVNVGSSKNDRCSVEALPSVSYEHLDIGQTRPSSDENNSTGVLFENRETDHVSDSSVYAESCVSDSDLSAGFEEEEDDDENDSEKEENTSVLLQDSNCNDIESILTSLQIVHSKCFLPNEILEKEPSLEIKFDLYLPGTEFKKSNPPLPDFRVVVSGARHYIPTSSNVALLEKDLRDCVPLLFAVVSHDSMTFFQYSSVYLPIALEDCREVCEVSKEHEH